MTGSRNFLSVCGALGVALLASSAGALADGYEVAAPAAVDEGRKFTYSFNIGATSDYVFRGISQTDNDPTMQGGARLRLRHSLCRRLGVDGLTSRTPPARKHRPKSTGTAASSRPGTRRLAPSTSTSASSTTPIPGPIRLRSGPISTTSSSRRATAGRRLHPSLVTGTTVYWSPDYFAETGPVWTIETMAAWTLPQVPVFTPVINGVLGWQKGDGNDGYFVNVNGTDDEYYYWNAGLATWPSRTSPSTSATGIPTSAAMRAVRSARRRPLRRALRVLRQGRGARKARLSSTPITKGDARGASPF